MHLGRKDFQIAAEISNDFNNLIPIGTLLYYNIPSSHALQGIRVGRGSWTVFDADFLHEICGNNIHESLKALIFLVKHRYFAATFKLIRYTIVSSRGQVPILLGKVRVYAIPLDIDGARFLRAWRRSWSKSPCTLDKKFKSSWEVLLKYLDFSSQNWVYSFSANLGNVITKPQTASTIQSSNSSKKTFTICIPFTPAASNSSSKHSTFYNLQRWINGQSFVDTIESPVSLKDVLRDVYVGIEAPDLSYYTKSPIEKIVGVPSPEEAIAIHLHSSQNGVASIKGVLADLYSFQLRSVCKMYEKESMSLRARVPHFVKITSPSGSTYYFDTIKSGFYSKPELYEVPKGGILAENMGLGKTLICLALVCLTKHETSVIPDNLMVKVPSRDYHKVPKLANLLVLEIVESSLPWKFFAKDLPDTVVRKLSNTHGYFHVAQDQIKANSGLRGRNSEKSQLQWKKLLLSNSTLVIVPENLLHQWNDEAKRHIEAGYLKKLFLSERFQQHLTYDNTSYTKVLPPTPEDIVGYDLVVISSSLFSKLGTRPQNVLMLVYWKRLIIDEGHSMSSRSSNLSVSCKLLYSERRWVVTGTPTSGLTNLHMDEDSAETMSESPRKRRRYVVKGKFNVRDDLAKLGSLVSNFFQIEPFSSLPRLWGSTIIKSLANHHQLTAKISLQTLLNSLMVRHNQAQVEADLQLPQLHHEAIFLQPSFQNKLALNLFTAVLAVNAVSSERVGVDYMFDPSNRQQLHRLMNNFQLSTFYWTGFKISDAQTMIELCKQSLKKLDAKGNPYYNVEDRRLLDKSLSAVRRAIGNPRWCIAASLHEMQIYVSGLPELYNRHFANDIFGGNAVYGAPQLGALQKFFYKNRFLDNGHEATLITKIEESSRSSWQNYWAQSQSIEKGKFFKSGTTTNLDTNHTKEDHELSSRSSNEVLGAPLKHRMAECSGNGKSEPRAASILGTASAKLSYLASKLVGHQKDGIKSIVFFEFEDSAFYLTELLDILGVRFILYATFVGAEKRSNNLGDFAAHDSANNGGIALIMDLKLAAHGLTIISATRVYFMSPVWQREVEAQAIKRAHRIGQTQQVYVETLVLKGTLEEEIYRRRLSENAIDPAQTQKKYVIDDTGMQSFVLRHAFLPVSETEQEFADFSNSTGTDIAYKQSQEVDSKYSLLPHSSRVVNANRQPRREWTMRLFNEGNLQKFNESKQEKPGPDQLNAEFARGKSQTLPVSHPKKASSKSVRF